MEKVLFGTLKDGREVYRISLSLGGYKIAVLTYGANLCYYGTEDFNAVLCHETLDEYVDDPSYQGAVVGPVANRIRKGRFSLAGKEYQLDINNGANTLHSGSACYGRQVWELAGAGANSITLALSTPEGLGGFPGSHDIMVTYSLYEDGCLNIQYKSTSSEKCPVAITNHAYFNLNGGGDIRDTILTLPCPEFVDVDEELIPIAVRSVEGTDFDFRSGVSIGERRNGAYDNTFVLDKNGIIRAEGRKAILECRTTEPSFQLYTAEFLEDEHGAFTGFCIETGRYPDTPNHEDYPQAFTAPGEEFISNTTFRLRVK